jgi:hypothetical protein
MPVLRLSVAASCQALHKALAVDVTLMPDKTFELVNQVASEAYMQLMRQLMVNKFKRTSG